MTPISFSIPDNAELPAWLDRQVVSENLSTLVGELTVIFGKQPAPTPLSDLIGDRGQQVLDRGLAALPAETLRRLLENPRLLFDLQTWVLTEGGPYWEELLDRPEVHAAVERVGQKLGFASSTLPAVLPRPRSRHLAAYVTAASIVLFVVVGWALMPRSYVGVLVQPEELAKLTSTREYFLAFERGLGAYDALPKSSPKELRDTILCVRLTCEAIRAAKPGPLGDDDLAWRVKRCTDWIVKLDQVLLDLSTSGDVAKNRADADRIVDDMIRALRRRAPESL